MVNTKVWLTTEAKLPVISSFTCHTDRWHVRPNRFKRLRLCEEARL